MSAYILHTVSMQILWIRVATQLCRSKVLWQNKNLVPTVTALPLYMLHIYSIYTLCKHQHIHAMVYGSLDLI